MELAEGKAAEAEEMPPKAGGCPPRHGHERIGRKDYGPTGRVFNAIKRCMVLRSLSLGYHCLGENVLANTLPSNPTAFTSKRKWETAIRKARETLRLTKELAVDMEPGALRRRLDDIYLHRREHVSPNLPQTQPVSVEIRP